MLTALSKVGERNPLAAVDVSLGAAASSGPELVPFPLLAANDAKSARLTRVTTPTHNPLRVGASGAAGLALPPPAAKRAPPKRAEAPRKETAELPVLQSSTVPYAQLGEPSRSSMLAGSFAAFVNARINVPLAQAASDAERLPVRASFENVVLPDGQEVRKGMGAMTFVVRNGEIVGAERGSIQLDEGAVTIHRGNAETVRIASGQTATIVSGALVMRDGELVGLAAHSEAEINGIRVRSGVDDVSYTLAEADHHRVGAGAVILATPTDRAVRISGPSFEVRGTRADVAVTDGTLLVDGEGTSVEAGKSRIARHLPDPPPADEHADAVRRGEIVMVRRGDGQLYVDGISHRDFDQGSTGDCWFIGSVLALAATRPELIEKMITDNRDGTFTVRFYREGKPVSVTVDDDFYRGVNAQANWSGGTTYAHSRDIRELWGPILEKAYALLHKDGYQGIWGGWQADAFRDLTNAPSLNIENRGETLDKLFASLERAVANRQAVVATSGRSYANPEERERLDFEMKATYGLRNWHAYAVINTVVENGERFVVMRNTGADVEFRTAAYDADVEGTPVEGADGLDGYFKVRIDDYQRLFHFSTFLQLPS